MNKKISNTLKFSVSVLVLGCVCVMLLFLVRVISKAAFPELANQPLPEIPEKQDEPPLPEIESQSIKSASLRYKENITDTAIEEMEDGRFIVETILPIGEERKFLYRELINRGGIIVRQKGEKHFLLSADTEVPLQEAPIDHNSMAYHRPRRIPAQDINLCGISAKTISGNYYLVMPKNFEAQIFTEIESTLRQPLSEYKKAEVSFSLSPGGYLSLFIKQAIHKDVGIESIEITKKGI